VVRKPLISSCAEGRVIRLRSFAPKSCYALVILFASLSAIAVCPRRAAAQNSTLLKGGVAVGGEGGSAVDLCNSCNLETDEAIASEDDRHDEADSAFDSEIRAENVSHDEADQAIEKSVPSEQKQVALANEEERHENTLKAIQRNEAIEALRHQQNLASIMAQAGKLLSDLVQNVMNGSSPGGGSPSTGGGGSPTGGGNPSMPTAPSGGSNPVAGGGQPINGSSPSGGGAAPPGNPAGGGGVAYPGGSPSGVPIAPSGGNPVASGGGSPTNPSGSGGQLPSGGTPNNPPPGTEYPGAQSSNPSQASQSSSSNPGTPGRGALKGLNDWINSIAQKMAPPPSTGTGQPYTGPLAINGHSPLYYLNEAANDFANKLPGGSSGLQQANQAVGNFANAQGSQWTTPMSGVDAAKQVGGAFVGGVVGKGLGGTAGALKGAYGQAIQNGAGRIGAVQAAGNSIGAATMTGLSAARQEAATLSGMGAAAAGGNVGGNPGGGEQTSSNGTNPGGGSYSGGVSSSGGSEPPGSGGGVGGGGPNEPGGGAAPGASEPSTTQTAQAGGQSQTQPGVGARGAPPAESVPPEPGTGTPSNPLTGAAVSNSWENLAGKTVVLNGQPVQLGKMMGSPGGFGTVYQMADDPSKVVKIVRPGNIGADSVTRQIQGGILANEAGIQTPAVYQSSAGANGDPAHLIMENVAGGKWSNVQMPSQAQLTPQQAKALQQMYDQLGNNGLIWGDGKLNNVFFYGSPEAPSVGILDPDMIFPSTQYPFQNPLVDLNLRLGASQAINDTLSDYRYDPGKIDALKVMQDRFARQFPQFAAQ
jgi:hypothetical protein